jgi:hypothetical protein
MVTTRAESVLLLTFARRGEEQAIREALVALEHGFPAASVFAVATLASAPVLKSVWVGDLILYDSPGSARQVLRAVAARKPRAAAIVYAGVAPEAHLKLEMLALRSGAPAVYRCLSGERIQVIGRLRLCGSVVCKAVFACARLAAAAGMCCVAFAWLRVAQLGGGGHGNARPTGAGGRRASRP